MTRSAEQAIDEAQAKLGERCERLLASSAWNKAHTTTHEGLRVVDRLLGVARHCGVLPLSLAA